MPRRRRSRRGAPPDCAAGGAYLALFFAAFGEITELALEFGDRDTVQRRLTENLARGVACHASYRIGDAP